MNSKIFGSENTNPNTGTVQYNGINAVLSSTWSSTQTQRAMIVPCAMTISNFFMAISTAPGSGKSYDFTIMKNGVATDVTVNIADSAVTATDSTHTATFAAGDNISLRSTPNNTPGNTGGQFWDMDIATSTNIAPILGTTITNLDTASTVYGSIMGGNAITWSTTVTDFEVIVPCAGTFSNLYVKLQGTPGAGKSYAFTLLVNGVASALTTTVSDAETTDSDTTHTVSVNAGDTVVISSAPSGTPTARYPDFSMVFTPTVPGDFFLGMGNASAPSASANNWEGIYGAASNGWGATESSEAGVLGLCTLKKMYVKAITAPGGSGTRTFTVRNNTASTALSVSLSGATTTGNNTNDVAIARNDRVAILSAITGTPDALTGGVKIGILINVTQPGAHIFGDEELVY